MYVCVPRGCILAGQKEVLNLQELELKTVVTHTVGAWNQSSPLEEPTLLPA